MKVYFEIQADDCGRAVNFYKELFGWKIARQEGFPIEYWRINISEGAILPRPVKAPSGGGTNAYVCSFEVANFDKFAEQALKLGARVALPKFAVPGVCYQGYFLDTEGNTFGVFQPDPEAK